MSVVQQSLEVTKQLLHVLQTMEGKDRDEVIQSIQKLLNKRQALLPSIQPPFSEEEIELGQELVRINQQIEPLLKQLQMDIQKDRNSFEKRKQSVKKYRNPYESLQFDGMFYDKRK
ncbi:flagellar protein FliT [Aeribacillus pallidus]|uniref:flagellar protein FliT n=1 Tax=Aeribacillus pallidus TaxID=33936 RepID=UPI003D1D9DE7